MYVIVGLGNPGKQYEHTRHNVGFDVIDILAEEYGISVTKIKHKALIGEGRVGTEKVLLVKPQTYMNLSGEAVLAFVKYYDIDPKDIIVVHDDLDLPIGKIRLREKGSCGGQNGMRNIIDLLHTQEIKRIRVGISKNKQIETKDYVLGKVDKESLPLYEEAVKKAAEALKFSFDHPFNIVMNKFN
jgi:PTH1 family peptidyl-tRNA hydrolase